ncbi:hypothetical protein ACVWWI_002770 [Bradyrhizobium sp. USDA 3686]|uniref:hypothetical protein n=1 Tax=Bradyrhizobium TaxID=374 RepID=UPI003908A581|nr:hypothetical protein [Bradyrhizobium canariense]
MKHVTERPFADPQAAARELIELAASIEPVQDGRIHIEKINYPFVSTLKGSGPEFGAGIRCAIEKGWLELHESGTYVRLLAPGNDLMALRKERAGHIRHESALARRPELAERPRPLNPRSPQSRGRLLAKPRSWEHPRFGWFLGGSLLLTGDMGR